MDTRCVPEYDGLLRYQNYAHWVKSLQVCGILGVSLAVSKILTVVELRPRLGHDNFERGFYGQCLKDLTSLLSEPHILVYLCLG